MLLAEHQGIARPVGNIGQPQPRPGGSNNCETTGLLHLKSGRHECAVIVDVFYAGERSLAGVVISNAAAGRSKIILAQGLLEPTGTPIALDLRLISLRRLAAGLNFEVPQLK